MIKLRHDRSIILFLIFGEFVHKQESMRSQVNTPWGNILLLNFIFFSYKAFNANVDIFVTLSYIVKKSD